MTRVLAFLMMFAVLGTACTPFGADEPDSPPSEYDCPKQWDDALREWSDVGFSGTVTALAAGEVDCAAAYGSADRADGRPNSTDTVFSIGSVSKAFTSAAVFRLVDDGRVRLRDAAGDIIPDLHGPAAHATVRQLLLHTSGLSGSIGTDHAPLSRSQAIRKLSKLRRAYAPGERYLYSNAGYTLLALIIDQVSGTSYRDYLVSKVLGEPNGIGSRGFWDGEPAAHGPRAIGYLDGGPTDQRGDFAGPHWALAGNGDLAMTTRDLATWTYALFSGEIVSGKSAREIAQAQVDHGDGTAETPGWVRFDAAKFGEPVIATSGGGGDIGHEAVVAWLPRSRRVLAIASNTPVVTAGDLMEAIAPALVADRPIPAPDTPTRSVDPAQLRRDAGTYRVGPDDSFEVTMRDGGLAVAASGEEAVDALFPRPGSVSAATIEAHEDAVLDLLAGETDEGREERELFESDLGSITGIEPAGTALVDGELRTYVTVTTATDSVLGWYALDESAAISAAEIPTDPPSTTFVPIGDRRYRPNDPTGDAPQVILAFTGQGMTVTGPDGSVRAESADR